MLTQEQISNLKRGGKVAFTYLPPRRKRLQTSIYLFDRLDGNRIQLAANEGYHFVFTFPLSDDRLSIPEEK